MVGEGAKVLVRRALADWHRSRRRRSWTAISPTTARSAWTRPSPIPGSKRCWRSWPPDYRMAVLSNKGERLSIEILEGLDLAWRFKAILGGDSLPTRKPNPAGLNALADRFDVPVERLMLIGDSRIDAETARNAGCAFALVEWGFLGTPQGRPGRRPHRLHAGRARAEARALKDPATPRRNFSARRAAIWSTASPFWRMALSLGGRRRRKCADGILQFAGCHAAFEEWHPPLAGCHPPFGGRPRRIWRMAFVPLADDRAGIWSMASLHLADASALLTEDTLSTPAARIT